MADAKKDLPEGVADEQFIMVDEHGEPVTDPKKASQIEIVQTMDDGTTRHHIMVPGGGGAR